MVKTPHFHCKGYGFDPWSGNKNPTCQAANNNNDKNKSSSRTMFLDCFALDIICLMPRSFSSVQLLSHVQLFATPWTAACQASLSITNSQSLLDLSIELVMPSNHLPSPFPLALNLSQHQGLFKSVSSLHQVAKILEFQLQHQPFQRIFRTDFLQDGLVGSPCSPRDSQESSPTPQFKSINSLVLSLFYSPTLTSTHDYWKTHSFDQMGLCWKSNVSAF